MPSEVSPPLVAATPSDLSGSWFIVLSYTDRRRKNSNKLMEFCLHILGRPGDYLRTPRTRDGSSPFAVASIHTSPRGLLDRTASWTGVV
jgi:hypothetical protein